MTAQARFSRRNLIKGALVGAAMGPGAESALAAHDKALAQESGAAQPVLLMDWH